MASQSSIGWKPLRDAISCPPHNSEQKLWYGQWGAKTHSHGLPRAQLCTSLPRSCPATSAWQPETSYRESSSFCHWNEQTVQVRTSSSSRLRPGHSTFSSMPLVGRSRPVLTSPPGSSSGLSRLRKARPSAKLSDVQRARRVLDTMSPLWPKGNTSSRANMTSQVCEARGHISRKLDSASGIEGLPSGSPSLCAQDPPLLPVGPSQLPLREDVQGPLRESPAASVYLGHEGVASRR